MPGIFLQILVCLIASILAGVGTGFVGMSAAVAITPMLIGFLGVDHYVATAIAIASDVLASAIAAIMYARHKNIEIKKSLPLLITVLLFTFGGTIAGYYVPNQAMNIGTIITIAIVGLKLLIFPERKSKLSKKFSERGKLLISLISGALIGFVCGFVGAGGGMMLLLVLTVFLGYEMHKAVGSSVFIMSFSALVGSSFHIIYDVFIANPPKYMFNNQAYMYLVICAVFTLVFSLIGSKVANKLPEKTLSLISGVMLICLAVTVAIVSNVDVITRFVNFMIIAINLNIIGLCSIWFVRKKIIK